MMEKSVLIISQEKDEHANIIEGRLKDRKANVYRLDTDKDFPRGVTMHLSGDVFTAEWNIEGQIRDLRDIDSVWLRKPIPPNITDRNDVPPEAAEYIRKESKEWLKSLCSTLDHAFWVNNPFDLQQANRKVRQLREATRVGLKVPDTIISDDPTQLRSFYEKHNGSIVAKTFRAQFLEDSQGTAILPRTQKIGRGDLESPDFYACPCLVQEELTRGFEIRVVVIGRELYAFRIEPKNTEVVSDIRALDLEKLTHMPYELSDETSKKLRRLLESFNLQFASLDLLVTIEGEEVFLELNPNGQWYWLEILTGEPLAERFCDLLVRKK